MAVGEHKTDPRREYLNDRKMKALKLRPGRERDVVWDAGMPGMAVRLTSKRGSKAFYAVKRRAGDVSPTWARLGEYPVMSLLQAREAAREALQALGRGEDPKTLAEAKIRAVREAEAEARKNTFRAVADAFMRHQFPSLSNATTRAYERQLQSISKIFGDKPITSLRRREIIDVIEGIRDDAGRPSAKVALAVLRRVLNWALSRDIEGFEANPAAGISDKDLIGRIKPRERVLSDAELAAVWRATTSLGEPWMTIYRLLMLLGLRRDEIASAQWAELDLEAGLFEIPAARTKNGLPMLVPLPPTAVDLFKATHRFGGPFVFSTSGGRSPVSAWSHTKGKLDVKLAHQGDAVPGWRTHDLRRVVRSGLSKLKVDHVVKELVLGHRQAGIADVYDKHDYIDEKREALERWETHLLSLVEPPREPDEDSSKVVRLRGARGAAA